MKVSVRLFCFCARVQITVENLSRLEIMQILVQNIIEGKQGSHLLCRVFDTTDLKCTLMEEEKKL